MFAVASQANEMNVPLDLQRSRQCLQTRSGLPLARDNHLQLRIRLLQFSNRVKQNIMSLLTSQAPYEANCGQVRVQSKSRVTGGAAGQRQKLFIAHGVQNN